MNKRIIIAVAIVAVVIVAVVSYVILAKTGKELPMSVENVDGRYNVTLSFFKDRTQIDYADETGNHSGRYFEPQMRTGLDWIKNNTPESAIFLCWWDYGHMIKGYAERNVTGRNPSQEWIDMVAEKSSVNEFDPNERLVDVAKALTTSNYTEMLQIMEKYGAVYVVIYKDDGPQVGKAWWMFKVAGLDPVSYQEKLENSTLVFNDAGKQTMLSRLLDNRDPGLTLVYQDAVMKVYKKDSGASEPGFRIYSIEDNALLIPDADILSYNWTSQEMAITPEASERLTKIGDLYSFTGGFVIKIDGEEIYRGIFREYTMSAIPAPPKISILFPSASFPFESVNYGAIRMFWPFFQPPGDQPVNNAKIFQYFEKINKLKY
jgi:hypothetical protein